MRTEKPGLSQITLQNENQDSGDEIQENDLRSKILDMFNECGYADPFMLIMDTKDAVVREQCLEIICDLEWQHDQHPRKKLNSRICSENGYDMFHGQAIKYSLSVRSANLLFCMLLGRHPGSVLIDISPPQLVISENEDNSTFALTHLAEAFMIKKICVLETIGEALAKEGKTELARAIIQRFENIVTNSFVNQCAFSKFSNWERWFIPLLDPITSADQMRQKPKLTNIEPISRLPVLLLKDLNTSVFGIFSEIWGYLFQNEKGGWRLFDQSVKLALSMQYRKLSHEHALLSRMFSVAIDSFLKIMYTKYVNQSFLFVRAHFKESTTFFDNLLHFVILCNDFLVFVPTAINIPRIPSPIIRSRNLFGMGNEDDEKSPVVENEQNAREIVSEHKKEPTQTGPHVLSRPYGDVTFSYSLRIQDNKWKDTTLVLKLISFLDQFDFFNIQTASSVFVDKHLASTTLCNLALLLVSGITRLKGIETKWFVEKLVKFVSNVESQTANIKTRDRNIILIILSHLFEASENEQKSRQNSNTSDSNTDQDRPLQVAQSIMKKTYSILVPLMKDNSGRTLLPKKRAGSIIFHKSQDELREMFFGNTEWKDAIQNSFHSEAEKHRKQLDLQSTNTASEMRERLRDVEISQKKYLIQKVSSFENLLQKFRLDWFSSFKSFINEQIISSAAKRERKMILSMDQWRRTLRSLASERGPWGARKTLFESTFWKLDKTEDNERRRRKMKQNYHFSNHFDASVRRDQSSKEMADKIITQNYDKIQLQKLSSQPNNDTQHLHLLDIQRHTSDIPEEDPDALPDQNDDSEPTNSNKLVFQANSFLVKPQSSTSGMFEITRSEIHFYPGKSAPQENHKRPTTPTESSDISPPNNTSHGDIQKDRTWRLKDLKSIFKKRFKMKNSALEFYFTDRTSYFFDFTPKTRNIIFRKINALKPPNLIRVDTGAPTEWLRKTNLTKRWQRYQITNFDYLVELNFLAGRSYNDLSQYPVFPWILSDYDSDKLDLQNPNSFRDLSKPIGSINENNLQQCIARYQTFEKANTGVPPFYYGSHYSTPAVVLHYLVRLEPFTTLFIDFQSGRFDSSDRMFHSVSELWKSCTGTTSDVRELIPEFFYFPEFLENSNRFDLGKRQNETQVDHVVLPNWATSPEDFIHKHRSALECEYVSQHIHEWIDLIFGFKQRGEEAIKAYNVFYYLTYPDSVDIDLIQNQTEKESIEMQIQNFGQTPTQVFKKPHPHRLSFAEQQNIHPLYWKITRFSSVVSNIIKITDSPILFIANSSRLVIFDAQRNLTTYRWCSTNPVVNSSENSTTSFAINKDENNPPKNNEIIPQINEQIKPSIQQSQSQQNSLIELDSAMKNTRRKVGVSFSFMLPKNNRRFAISTNEKIIFSCGYWDNSFKLNQLDTTKLVQSIEYHKDVVTCLSFHKNTLVTGSRDTTVAVWRFSSKTNTVNEKPRHVLFGHDDNVTCVDVNEDLDIIISASQDGSCIMHTLRRGRYVRTIRVDPQTDVPISSVYITAVGDVIIYCEKSSTLWLFSINGKNLLSIRLNSSVRSFLFTQNGDFAFCGMENGAIHILRISDLKIIQSLFFHSPVLSLSFSQDEKQIVAGFADGMLLILFFMKN
ncbi:beige/beach-related [Anaeramoeba ignava]|uniref:Beige/beach-related n=1 Tax=Anaeramoeba ignava TaxID=1746090 RepID=A0A9Q0R6N3_ANAIG|nr:beige/beach-related [Anaeramoeba ignava]